MKLFYTTTSPYARKARIVAIEAGVAARLRGVPTTVRDPESPLLALNPVGMVPTLVTADGVVLCESSIICAYLTSLEGARPLLPGAGRERRVALAREGLARGLLDGLTARVRALRLPEERRDEAGIARERARADRCLAAFEEMAARGGLAGAVDLPRITLGCALGVLDFRLPSDDWRRSHPALDRWFQGFAARPSMQETKPFE